MKYTYKIIGLDCVNCAKKIEDTLNKNKDFKNVIINFSTSKITYETNISNSLKIVNEIISKIEPNAKILEDEEKIREYHISILIISTILGIIGCYTKHFLSNILIYISYILLLYKPFISAIKLLIKSKTINENMLVTISCVGALLIDKKFEGIMVAALYLLGKILEEKAINKTRNSVSNLINIKQEYANLKTNNKLKKVLVNEIKVDDILCVKKGERVPVDGVIVEGITKFSTSDLTGESELLEGVVGTKILSGFINTGDIILMQATSIYQDSTIAKILDLVENAGNKKATLETTVSKLSKFYTPSVLILSILVFIFLPIITNLTYIESMYRALTFLVIACPCAILISIPLSYFTGIGVASKKGILIKGSNYLDNLNYIDKIIFDKTGTLTTGKFQVEKIDIIDKKYTYDEIIKILRLGESYSNHPIAKSIISLSNEEIDNKEVLDYKEIEGQGISFKYKNNLIKIGNKNICSNCKLDSSIHLNINSNHVASIYIDDGIKKNTNEVISKLKKMGIKCYMFTGDKKENALLIAKKINIDKVYYEMLPTSKYEEYEKLEKKSHVLAFVGDGINDSPVIKRANIGISMGSMGSDAAILASDIVIMNDDLDKILLSIKISKYTNLIIKENLIFSISIKVLILILSIFGLSSMWFAVFADTGVTVLTILNSLRIMLKFK